MTIWDAIRSNRRKFPKGIVFRSIRNGELSKPMTEDKAKKYKDEWTPGWVAKFGYLFIDIDRIVKE